MPCDQIVTTSVNLEVADKGLLRDAVTMLVAKGELRAITTRENLMRAVHGRTGLDVTVDFESGQLLMAGSPWQMQRGPDLRNAINRAYAHETIKAAASEFGWALDNNETPDEYLVVGQ